MRLHIVRHGEAMNQGGPERSLTARGEAEVDIAGGRLAEEGVGGLYFSPKLRTRQTAEEILLVFSAPIPTREAGLPELMEDWDTLVESLTERVPEDGVALLIGHHPTMDMIKRELGPIPVSVPRGNFASAVVLQSVDGGWLCTASWPGRPA